VSAFFACIVASSSLTAAPDSEEKEKPADKCLLGPSASTSGGGHWYYRIDRVNKRNCWYLGEEKEKAARKPVAEEDAAPAEKSVAPPPKKPATVQRSITDAHAELPQPGLEQDARPTATQRNPAAPPVDVPRADSAQRPAVNDAGKAATTRWPEPSVASPAVSTPPATGSAQVTRTAEAQPAPVAPPARPAAPPAPLAAAQAGAGKPMSLPMILTVLAGALSVVGVFASALFGRGKSRSRRLSRSAPMPPLEFPERPRAPDDPRQRIEQMMAQINRRNAA
jgi:hypothetical protein